MFFQSFYALPKVLKFMPDSRQVRNIFADEVKTRVHAAKTIIHFFFKPRKVFLACQRLEVFLACHRPLNQPSKTFDVGDFFFHYLNKYV